jgi:hypothetical protein
MRIWTLRRARLLEGRKDSDGKVKFGACTKPKYRCYGYWLEAVQPSGNIYGMADVLEDRFCFLGFTHRDRPAISPDIRPDNLLALVVKLLSAGMGNDKTNTCSAQTLHFWLLHLLLV